MEDFIASLVREKMTFADHAFEGVIDDASADYVIRSNRIFLKLKRGPVTEKVVIRAQTMHLTLLLASKIMFSFFKNGLFLNREQAYDWDLQWDAVQSAYERKFNTDAWASVYINGSPVFRTQASQYIDIVEKCALMNTDNYDAVVVTAEMALKQLGQPVRINHSSHVAAVFSGNAEEIKCGIVHRSDGKNLAFNFIAAGGAADRRIVQGLNIAAAFLEGLNLRLVIRDLQNKRRMQEISAVSPEATRLRMAVVRRSALEKYISSFEKMYDVTYRPSRPDLFNMD